MSADLSTAILKGKDFIFMKFFFEFFFHAQLNYFYEILKRQAKAESADSGRLSW